MCWLKYDFVIRIFSHLRKKKNIPVRKGILRRPETVFLTGNNFRSAISDRELHYDIISLSSMKDEVLHRNTETSKIVQLNDVIIARNDQVPISRQ